MPNRMGNLLTPPVIAWRRCHPPLRGGNRIRPATCVEPISNTRASAGPPSTQHRHGAPARSALVLFFHLFHHLVCHVGRHLLVVLMGGAELTPTLGDGT